MKTITEWAREKEIPSYLLAALTRKPAFGPSVVISEKDFDTEVDRLKNSTVETGV